MAWLGGNGWRTAARALATPCACASAVSLIRPASDRSATDSAIVPCRPASAPSPVLSRSSGRRCGPARCEEKEMYDTGVILANLGTPADCTAPAVKKFLAEFLHDYRVVDTSRWQWCPILHGIILRKRPPKIAELYKSIWTEDGSPIKAISFRQRDALTIELSKRLGKPVKVIVAMRYGDPSIKDGFKELEDENLRRVVVLPMYPQYSSATTGSTFDGVALAMKEIRGMPDMKFVHHYHDDPAYIKCLAGRIKEYWKKNGKPEKLLFSFHGIPVRYMGMGDYYNEHCDETAEKVAAFLGLKANEWHLSYQSQFGREEWLGPKTDGTLEEWGKNGMKRVDVVCPGFAADCLETLEEIAGENRIAFQGAGGGDFHYIPCLNDGADHIQALADILERQMKAR